MTTIAAEGGESRHGFPGPVPSILLHGHRVLQIGHHSQPSFYLDEANM